MVGLTDRFFNWVRTGDSKIKVNKTCHDPAQDLVNCVSNTPCFQSGRSLNDCSTNDDETGNMCRKPIAEYYLCRKFSVNHTKHFTKETYK